MKVMWSWSSWNWNPVGSGKQGYRWWRYHGCCRDDRHNNNRLRQDKNRRGHCNRDDGLDHGRGAGGSCGADAESPADSPSHATNTEAPMDWTRLWNMHRGGRQREPQNCGFENHRKRISVAGFDWVGFDLFRNLGRVRASCYSNELDPAPCLGVMAALRLGLGGSTRYQLGIDEFRLAAAETRGCPDASSSHPAIVPRAHPEQPLQPADLFP